METSKTSRTETTVGGKIVKLPTEHYRKVAQKHWGLTDEQMVGMHVHHYTPQSQGGTDDPSNLYVCSAWFHYHVWHERDRQKLFIESASRAGKKGGKAPSGENQRAAARKTGQRNVRDGIVSKAGKVGSAQRWQCTETGFVSNAGNLAKYHRARGIDTSCRVRIE